jgi:TonB family protein
MNKSSYPAIYKGCIYTSIVIHVLIVSLILLTSQNFWHKPIIINDGISAGSINVDMVGLPNVLKKDLNLLNESRRQEQDNLSKTIKEKDQMSLPDTKKIKQARLSAIERLKKSVAYEKTYLEKLKIIKGLRKSTDLGRITDKSEDPNPGTGAGEASDVPSNPYFNTLKDLIRTYWQVPHWMNTEGLNTLVATKLRPSGEISSIDIIKSSGSRDFDNLALNAIRNAAPFPTPPVVVRDALEDGIVFSFP